MSLTTALLINVVMIVTTLVTDCGTRAVGWGRLLRPLLIGTPIALYYAAGLVTRIGLGYLGFWIAACVARFAFSYGAQHWFGYSLGSWSFAHGVALSDITAVITDAIVFSVVAMLLARSAGIAVRARVLA